MRPLPLLLLATLALGLLTMAGAWAAPFQILPDHPFVEGHFVGALLGREGLLWTDRLAPDGGPLRPLMWPLACLAVVTGPTLAVNLVWTLVPPFNAACGYAFGRSLKASPSGAALTGALLAWAPMVRTTLGNGQVEQAALGGTALIWASCLWTRRWSLVVAPAVLLAVGLAAPNIALAACLGLLVLLPWRFVQDRRHTALLAVLLALVLLPLQAYHGAAYEPGPRIFAPRTAPPQYAVIDLSQAVGWQATRSENLSDATLRSLVEPVGPRGFEAPVVHSPYLGWSLLVLGVAGLAMGRQWVLAGASGILLLACLGSQGGLMSVLGAVVPSVAESSSAYRLVAGLLCALAGLAAALESRLGRWTPLLGILAWAETALLPNHPLVLPTRPALDHPELEALEVDGAVLDLPLADVPCTAEAMHYLAQVQQHDGRLLHGAGSLALHPTLGAQAADIHGAFPQADCPELLRRALEPLELEAVILHQHQGCRTRLPGAAACLTEAFGEPRGEGTVLWWRL